MRIVTHKRSNASAIAEMESRARDLLIEFFENDKTGLFYKTFTIGKDNLIYREEDGVYLLMGVDFEAVNNIASDASIVLEEYKKQNYNSNVLYPRCTVVKFNDIISGYSNYIDMRNRLDLICAIT